MLLEKVRSERTLSTFNCYLNVFRIAIGINTGCKVVLSTKYNKLINLIAFTPRCSKPSNNLKVSSNISNCQLLILKWSVDTSHVRSNQQSRISIHKIKIIKDAIKNIMQALDFSRALAAFCFSKIILQ